LLEFIASFSSCFLFIFIILFHYFIGYFIYLHLPSQIPLLKPPNPSSFLWPLRVLPTPTPPTHSCLSTLEFPYQASTESSGTPPSDARESSVTYPAGVMTPPPTHTHTLPCTLLMVQSLGALGDLADIFLPMGLQTPALL
jgi:hypothetical protein